MLELFESMASKAWVKYEPQIVAAVQDPAAAGAVKAKVKSYLPALHGVANKLFPQGGLIVGVAFEALDEVLS